MKLGVALVVMAIILFYAGSIGGTPMHFAVGIGLILWGSSRIDKARKAKRERDKTETS